MKVISRMKFVYLFSLTGVLLASQAIFAKSLYVVSLNSHVIVFQISGNQLAYQTDANLPVHGFGPIDIEIDSENDMLFVCHEDRPFYGGGNILELYNSVSLMPMGTITLDGAVHPTNVTGLAYDLARHRLYCTDRNTNDLYVYDWDADNHTLTYNTRVTLLDGSSVSIDYACGLALNGDTLYVSKFLQNPVFPTIGIG